MIEIALAHKLPYVATASVGYPLDVIAKVKKALTIKGPKYLQLYTPCVPGWGIEPKDTLGVGQSAVQSGYYPIVEYINGKLVKVQKITKKVPIEEFLLPQKRFKHITKSPEGKKEIAKIQKITDEKIKKYDLI